jgi:outer membrane protein assembly factor BamB
VVDGVVYVGSWDGNLYAVDAADGDYLWQFATGDSVESSPAVVDGVVYVGGDGFLFAVNAADGAELWRFATVGHVLSSPAVVDGVVYVSSYNDGASTGFLYAVDAAGGDQRWRFDIGLFTRSSPAVVDGVVYIGGGRRLYAVDAAAGSHRWQFDTDDNVESSPAVVDGVVYVGSLDGALYAVNAADGTERWSFEADDGNGTSVIQSSPAVVDGVVYIGNGDGNLYAIGASVEPTATETTEDPIEEAPAGVTVAIVGFDFDPADLEIAADTTVTWTNEDDAPHTVTADNGEFDSDKLDQGNTFSFTFDEPGTYPYHCDIHPRMQGTIVVT